jgi:hypothetical protein
MLPTIGGAAAIAARRKGSARDRGASVVGLGDVIAAPA